MPIVSSNIFKCAAIISLALLAGCAHNANELEITGLTPHPMTAAEIAQVISDHTAVMPDGSFEYYAADGKLYGSSDGQPYQGAWGIKDNLFCTLLDNEIRVCSEVGRDAKGVFWSPDGEKKITRIAELLPGNPKNLK